MKHEFFYQESLALQQLAGNLDKAHAAIQNAVEAFNRTAETPLKSIDELKSFFTPDRKLIPERVTDALFARFIDARPRLQQEVELYGIRETQDRLRIEGWPPERSELDAALQALTGYFASAGWRDELHFEAYRLEGATVVLNIEAVETLKQRYRSTVQSDEQRARLQSVESLVTAITNFYLLNPAVNPEGLQIPGLIAYDSILGVFQAVPGYVLHGTTNAPTLGLIHQQKIAI